MNLSNPNELLEREPLDMPANRPFQMRASDEFWQGVDDWRRLQPDMPNRAEAIRRLVAIGLRATPRRSGLRPLRGGQRNENGVERNERFPSYSTASHVDWR